MGVLKSCFFCTLKTGSFFVAFYTFFLAILLLIFNISNMVRQPNYLPWTHYVSFVGAIALFFAALCLLIGLIRNSPGLLGVWLVIFLCYIIYQIAFVCWNIFYFTSNTEGYKVPDDSRNWFLANIITFGILIFVNILALVTVHSEREHVGGGMVV